jgi:hypothetical protein
MEHVVIFVGMYINAVADSVMLYLHDCYNIIFKIKHKLYIASGSAPTKEKFWVRVWLQSTLSYPHHPPWFIIIPLYLSLETT